MKNRQSLLLILITCVFAAFTLGFLTGRLSAPGDTIVARMPPQTKPAAAAQPTVPPVNQVTAISTVTVPPAVTEPSIPETTAAGSQPTQAAGLLNINTATLAQLDSLPGIGTVIGQRIIDYREENGPFTSVSQLILVDGIGEKRLAAIIDLITVE